MTLQLHYSGFDQRYTFNEIPFTPRVYLSATGQVIPSGYNAVCLSLPMGLQSKLKWDQEKKWAEEYIQAGLKLVFAFEMDLHELFRKEAERESPLLSLQLGIDQFNQVFGLLKEHTIGCVVYQGEILKAEDLEFLKILISALPDEVASFLLLDAHGASDEEILNFLSLEDLTHFHLAMKGEFAEKFPYAYPMMGFDHGHSALGYFSQMPQKTCPSTLIKNAICLPLNMGNKVINALQTVQSPFRLIPEWALTTAWDGIDTLYIDRENLSQQGARKVRGFQAAGGSVIDL